MNVGKTVVTVGRRGCGICNALSTLAPTSVATRRTVGCSLFHCRGAPVCNWIPAQHLIAYHLIVRVALQRSHGHIHEQNILSSTLQKYLFIYLILFIYGERTKQIEKIAISKHLTAIHKQPYIKQHPYRGLNSSKTKAWITHMCAEINII